MPAMTPGIAATRAASITPRQAVACRPLSAVLYLLIAILVASAGSLSVWAEERYGRACLVVEERSAEGPQTVTTTAFDEQSAPGPNTRLTLYADASLDTSILVAFFDHDHRLANGWRPQLVELKAWEERRLPLSPITWEWTSEAGPFEGYVVFVGQADPQFAALGRLIGAMQEPKAESALLDAQARKLRELILQGMAGGQDATPLHAGATPRAWGGTLRGEESPWPTQAQKAVFGANGRALLTYHHGP